MGGTVGIIKECRRCYSCDYFVMWVELDIFISDVGGAGVVIIHKCGWVYSSKCGWDCRYY